MDRKFVFIECITLWSNWPQKYVELESEITNNKQQNGFYEFELNVDLLLRKKQKLIFKKAFPLALGL